MREIESGRERERDRQGEREREIQGERGREIDRGNGRNLSPSISFSFPLKRSLLLSEVNEN
jgi:hypothetical protein